jgi:uncharacterized Zn finger protein
MKSILSLITPEQLEKAASRSVFRHGKEIEKNGEIKITKENTFNIIADVRSKYGTIFTTELHSTTKGFRWKCGCTNKKNYFCEHCVAVGLKKWKDLPST